MTELVFPPAPPRPPKPRRFTRVLVVWIVVTLVGLGVGAYGLGTDVLDYRTFRVAGAAMTPGLKPGDSIVVRARHGDEVHRGDVVMFDRGAFAHPVSAGVAALRVVAVAGDVVACCTGGQLVVDGKPITETYLSQDEYAHDQAATTPYLTRMHEGTVFVLGDERGRARDSRFLGVVRLSGVTGFVVGTGGSVHPKLFTRTTAFTDAGLPGAPFEDLTFTTVRWWLAGGVAVFAVGLIGLIVAAVRNAGKRRTAAASPPVR